MNYFIGRPKKTDDSAKLAVWTKASHLLFLSFNDLIIGC